MFKPDIEEQIKKYIKEKYKVTIPEIQVKFGLSYADVFPIVSKLCEEGFMTLGDGLDYTVSADSYSLDEMRERLRSLGECSPDFRKAKEIFGHTVTDADGVEEQKPAEDKEDDADGDEEERKLRSEVLAFCVASGDVTISQICRRIPCGFMRACKTAEWLEDNLYITKVKVNDRYCYRTAVSKTRYIKEFGTEYAARYWDVSEYSTELLKKLSARLPQAPLNGDGYLQQKKSPAKEMPVSYRILFPPKFNIAKARAGIRDMDKQAEEFIGMAQSKAAIFGPEWDDSRPFESVCMDVIEDIIGKNVLWVRMDAVTEAAKLLVIMVKGGLRKQLWYIHARVLYELLDGSDEDYERLKKQIWSE